MHIQKTSYADFYMKASAPYARLAFLPLGKKKKKYFRNPKNHMENKISLYHLIVQRR